jgi:glutamine amidotransferase
MGNLASVQNALDHLKISSKIIHTPAEIKDCDKLILPGVGAFGQAMQTLHELHFADELKEVIANGKKPVLGLCLGMQLLFEQSEEMGEHKGLGVIPGKVVSLKKGVPDFPVPHMGWNHVTEKKASVLLANIPEEERVFYFVHGFYCQAKNEADISGTTDYGINMDTITEHQHIFGCQFHPEKSQQSGLQILKNFAEL